MWNRHDQIIRKIIVGDDWVIKLLFEHCKVGLPCCIPTAVQEEDYILLSLQELNFYNVRIVWSKHWETRGVVVAFYLFYGISSGCGQRFSWHSVRFLEVWLRVVLFKKKQINVLLHWARYWLEEQANCMFICVRNHSSLGCVIWTTS